MKALWRFLKGLVLTLIVVIALLNLAARVAMTQLDRFKPELALLFEDAGIEGLQLERMTGEWQGWRPRFHFQGVRLQVPGDVLPALAVRELELTVKPFVSLFSGRLRLAALKADVESLELNLPTTELESVNMDSSKEASTRMGSFSAGSAGSISPAGKPPGRRGAADKALDLERTGLRRLLSSLPDRLNLQVETLVLRSRPGSEALTLEQVNLQSRRWRIGRRLYLHALLPQRLGRELSLRIDGDLREQHVYLEAGDLALQRLARLAGKPIPRVDTLRADLRSWADFDEFRLVRVQNLARVKELRLAGDNGRRGESLTLNLSQLLMREDRGWRSDLRISDMQQAGRDLPSLNSQQFRDEETGTWMAWLERLDIATASNLLQPLLDEPQAARLSTLAPRGQLNQMLLSYPTQQPGDSRWAFSLDGLRIRRADRIPAVDNLSLQLQGRGPDARGQLSSPGLRLDFGDLFRNPLEADVEARLRLGLRSDRLLLESPFFRVANPDAEVKGRLRLEAEPGRRPFLSLRARSTRANPAATSRYLPVRIMSPASVVWLDQAIQGGEIRQADILFQGRTHSLKQLTERQAGEFDARLQIVNPQLKYRPGWPEVSRGNGVLEFHNLSMKGDFEDVDFARAMARKVRVEIEDMSNARLQLQVSTRDDALDMLDSLATVKELPVFQTLREPTEAMSGPVSLQLALDIPLTRKHRKPLRVDADLDFQGLSWKAPDWLVDMENLRGGLKLQDRRLTSRQLSARYGGDPVKIALDSDLDGGKTRITADGRIETRRLLGKLPPMFAEAFQGRSEWKVRVDLSSSEKARPVKVDIRADSDLSGTGFTLPAPLSLPADRVKPVHFEATITPRQFVDFRLDMKPHLALQGRYDPIAEGDALQQIEYLNLALGKVDLPIGDAGLRLRGRMPRLDVDAWQAWLQQHGGDLGFTGEGLLSRVQLLELQVKRLGWAGRNLDELKLETERQGSYLVGRLSSTQTAGELRWPLVSGPNMPIVADLDYLHLPPAHPAELKDWKPKIEDMPNLVLVSRDFRWRDMAFDDLVIRSVNDGQRFEVQRLDLRRDQVLLRATGHWQHQGLGGDDITVFNIAIKGRKFGQVVEKLGLGETLSGGDIDFFGQIGWGGAIDDINWDTLIGEVSLTLKNGYLRNVDPGAGRFVGLLSFSALPRRLYLDFGDVVREGLEFRKIKGKFTIQGELLKTDNAWMDSPSAKVRIRGITNLRTKTYDQTMYIIPKVGDTLPVIGAIAGGSGIGWGILLLQKIFKKPIDKSVEIEYRVTGSWDNPRIELVKKPAAKEEKNEEPFQTNPNS